MLFGAVFRSDKFLAGSEVIPGPYPAPNITPHEVTGIGQWTIEDMVRALKRSIRPDGVPIRGPWRSTWTAARAILFDEDLEAAATYLFSLEAQEGPVRASEERVDRRLQTDAEPQSGDGGASGGGGMGSAGMGLLRAASGGRTRAK